MNKQVIVTIEGEDGEQTLGIKANFNEAKLRRGLDYFMGHLRHSIELALDTGNPELEGDFEE